MVEEYPSHVGWGHATPNYAVAVCRAAGVARLALTHHDPNRTDEELDAILASRRSESRRADRLEILAAAEGLVIELGGSMQPATAGEEGASPTTGAEIAVRRVVIAALEPEAAMAVRAALAAEGLPSACEAADAEALHAAAADDAALLVVGAAAAADLAPALREAQRRAAEEPRPILILDGIAKPAPDGLVAEWLRWPAAADFLQAKIRAAALRGEARWVPAPPSADEADRLDDLRLLGLLARAPDARFDRIVRVTSAALRASGAFINLIDAERQVSVAAAGLPRLETSREAAFCAYTILSENAFIVPDTLEDARFADNPCVTGGPRIRFYAGAPVRSPRGRALGSLCVVDTRPRRIDERQVELLRDLADMVEAEIAVG